jgi:hypothetical protein
MTTWQYAQIRAAGGTVWWTGPGEDYRLDKSDVIAHLNDAGRNGWELVGVAEAATGSTLVTKYVLKRKAEVD